MIDDTEAKAARVDRYEKNLPSWLHGTPEDVDAWIRDLIPDDKRLAFYQWIGALAVATEIGISYGTVYGTFRQLYDLGWAVGITEEKHPGRPARVLYRPTEEGRKQLAALLGET